MNIRLKKRNIEAKTDLCALFVYLPNSKVTSQLFSFTRLMKIFKTRLFCTKLKLLIKDFALRNQQLTKREIKPSLDKHFVTSGTHVS